MSLLKKDRTEYIRAKDVLDIYSSLLDQGALACKHAVTTPAHLPRRLVNRLNEIRSPSTPKASTSAGNQLGDPAAAQQERSSHQENRVDTILNDVFQLLSLFFLTIGKSREAPAAFCQLASIKRLLTHLNESGIYTESDLKPFHTRLQELKTVIESGQSSSQTDDQEPPLTPTSADQHDAPLNKLLLTKWSDCDRLLQKLQSSLSRLSPELAPLHQRLITLRRLLASILARPKPSAADTAPILNELRAIEDKRVNGKFVVDGKEPELGQELCAGLLEDNFDIAQEIQAKEGEQEVQRGPLQPIYDRLSELRAQLERLVLTHRWTLRETDLYNYQMALQEIDRMRVDGKFRDSEGNTPKGQIVLLYLLRRCYGLCYRLMASSEPISEELMPIANVRLNCPFLIAPADQFRRRN